jgi:hypothetical protein
LSWAYGRCLETGCVMGCVVSVIVDEWCVRRMGWEGSGGLRQVRKESWIHKSYVCVGDGLFASEFDKAVRRYKTEVCRGTDWLHLVRHAGLHTTYCCAIRH